MGAQARDDEGTATRSAAPRDPRTPVSTRSVIDRYQIVREIGQGGMGVVSEAIDETLHRRVALKLLAARPGHGAAREHRIREARALARLAHPNVVAVYDAGAVGDDVFIAMELVDGVDLAAWVRAAPRHWRAIVRAFIAAGRGLAAAHAAGLVHRDFKPSNVLVGDGSVKVGDFGLADDAGAITAAATGSASDLEASTGFTVTASNLVAGTLPYMAPEQHRGQVLTAATDQFAFGVALYECLSGARPFAATDHAALLGAKLAGPPPLRAPGVPGWLGRVVARALAPSPADRFPSMDAVVAALERGLARRRRVATAAALAAAALALAAAVAVAVTRDPAPAVSSTVVTARSAAVHTQGRADLAALEREHGRDHMMVVQKRVELASFLWNQGDLAGALGLLDEARASLLRTVGERHAQVGLVDYWRAYVNLLRREYAEARAIAGAAVALYQGLGDLEGTAEARTLLARIVYESGDRAAGVAMGRQARAEAVIVGDRDLVNSIDQYLRAHGESIEPTP